MRLFPIALFVFNRPDHTLRTLKSLSANYLAEDSTLFIYSDGPKKGSSEDELRKIEDVRRIIKSQEWCGEVVIKEEDHNHGLASSIIRGVTDIVNTYGGIIVLEDDLVTSKGFLSFINEIMNLYENQSEIASVTGYIEPIKSRSNSFSFCQKGSSWGWGTWKRDWNEVNFNIDQLIAELNSENRNSFDFAGYPYFQMLQRQKHSAIDSWAIRYYASCFVRGKMHIVPNKSLVRNIGFDGTGIHCGISDALMNQEITDAILVEYKEPELDPTIEKKIRQLIRRRKMKYRFNSILRRIVS